MNNLGTVIRTLVAVLLMAVILPGASTAVQAADVSAIDTKDLARQLEMARKELDAAARKLARLYETSAKEKVRTGRAMLGVFVAEPDKHEGILLDGVTPNAGAARAGLRSGDRILSVNGIALDGSSIHPHAHIGVIMRKITPGATVSVEYLRKGEVRETQVVTYAASHKIFKDDKCCDDEDMTKDVDIDLDFDFDTALRINGQPLTEMLHEAGLAGTAAAIKVKKKKDGLVTLNPELAEYFDTSGGVLVVERPSKDSKLRAGDVIVSVEDGSVDNVEELINRCDELADYKVLSATVVRRGKPLQLSVPAVDLQFSRRQSIHIMGSGGDLGEVNVVIEDGS